MLRSLFLSSTSLLFVVAGCSDDTCGPGAVKDTGVIASSADVTLTYAGLYSGQNNDCPDPEAPAGVISLTIQGVQTGVEVDPGLLTLCIGRPDLLADKSIPLGLSGARIIDLNGLFDGCRYTFDSSLPPSGTVSASGLCDNGANAAGYALTVDGALSLKLATQQPTTCTKTSHNVAVTFDGTTAVVADQP